MNHKCFILFILMFALFSCRRDNGITSTSVSTFTEDSYPLAVGDWWQYQFTFCYGGAGTDTITLSVVSSANSGPYINYKCYYLYHGTVTDSGYFLQSDTSLSFTNASPYPNWGFFPNFHFTFPVTTGKYWQGAFPGDSTLVVGVSDKCEGSYGNYYGPCYSTVESHDLPHNLMINTMTLTPKIGLVNQSFDYVSDTAKLYGFTGVDICQSLNLISYHVQ